MILWLFRSALLFLVAMGTNRVLSRRSPALRHLVWVGCFLAIAILPFLPPVAPKVSVPTPTFATQASVRTAASPSNPVPSVVTPSTSNAVPEPPAPASEISWPSVLWAVYVFGVVAGAGRLAIGLWQVRAASKDAQPVRDPSVPERVRILRAQAGADVSVPMTFGWRSVTVLLPSESAQWSPERTAAVLLHELAHVTRGDWLTQSFASLVALLQWPNPLAWLALRNLRAEAEESADDLVLNAGIRPTLYASELVEIAARVTSTPNVAVAMARRGGVEARVRAIIDSNRDRRVPGKLIRRAVMGAAVVGSLSLSGVGSVTAAEILDGRATESDLFVEELPSKQVEAIQDRQALRAWRLDGNMRSMLASDVPVPEAPSGFKVREIVIRGERLEAKFAGSNEFLEGSYDARTQRNRFVLTLPAEATTATLLVRTNAGLLVEGGSLPKEDYRIERAEWGGFEVRIVRPVPKAAAYVMTYKQASTTHAEGDSMKPRPFRDPRIGSANDRVAMTWLRRDFGWRRIGAIPLDPAQGPATSPEGMQIRRKLPNGIVASLFEVEERLENRPLRAWAPDGGPAVEIPDTEPLGSLPVDPRKVHRSVHAKITGISWGKDHGPSIRWRLPREAHLFSSGSGITEYGGRIIEGVTFELPASIRAINLKLGIADGDWVTGTVEGLGGSLRAALSVEPNLETSTPEGPIQWIEFVPPAAVALYDLRLQAFDAEGKEISRAGRSHGPSTNLDVMNPFCAEAFRVVPGHPIRRVCLQWRPFAWLDFPNVAMHPRR